MENATQETSYDQKLARANDLVRYALAESLIYKFPVNGSPSDIKSLASWQMRLRAAIALFDRENSTTPEEK